MVSRRIGVLVLSAVPLLPNVCGANPVSLDQFYIPNPNPPDAFIVEATQTVAQTFTVGLGGELTATELQLGCCRFGPPSDDLLVEIRSTLSDGLPSTHVLASTVLHPADIPVDSFAFVRAALGPDSFRVSPGVLLSMVLSTSAPALEGGGVQPYAWFTTDGPGQYDRGQVFIDRGSGFLPTSVDMGFKTLVDVSEVPEPAGLALAAAGLLILFAGRRFERTKLRILAAPSRFMG
jgi:hypothetical protein